MKDLIRVDKEQRVSKGKGNSPPNFVKYLRCGKETICFEKEYQKGT